MHYILFYKQKEPLGILLEMNLFRIDTKRFRKDKTNYEYLLFLLATLLGYVAFYLC